MSERPTIPSEIWITVSEAATLLQLKPATVIRRIQSGKLIGHCNEASGDAFASNESYSVLLNALSHPLQQQYGEAQLSENRCLALDLLSIRESKGNRSEEHVLKVLRMFHEAALIRRTHSQDGTITPRLKELARKHGISLRTLYRYEATPEIQAATPMFLDPFYLSKHMPKTLCLLAIDLAYWLFLDQDHRWSQNAILRQIQSLASEMHCVDCPYLSESAAHVKTSSSLPNAFPECQLKEEQMIAPSTRHSLNRLLARIPPQQICYCREGVRAWHAKFGHFAVREKSSQVNACFQGDHHVFDLFVDHSMADRRGKIVSPE